jgi:hypothetical protein
VGIGAGQRLCRPFSIIGHDRRYFAGLGRKRRPFRQIDHGSPFTFYRGAAKIMAADLDGTPTAGVVHASRRHSFLGPTSGPRSARWWP